MAASSQTFQSARTTSTTSTTTATSSRFLSTLAADEQGLQSTVFLYGSPSRELCILKAARNDKPAHVKALRNEFAFLTDIGQLSTPTNTAATNNNSTNSPTTTTMHQIIQSGESFVDFSPLLDCHPHIVRALGYRSDFSYERMKHEVLVLEYCANGSLLANMLSNPGIFSPFTANRNSIQPRMVSLHHSLSPQPISQSQQFISTATPSNQQAQLLQQQQQQQEQHSMEMQQFPAAGCHSNLSIPGGFDTRSISLNFNLKTHIPLVRTIFKEIVSGVAFIHSRGKYHGDLKLANVLFDSMFSVKLADFGTAASTFSTPSPTSSTPLAQSIRQPHQAPEYFQLQQQTQLLLLSHSHISKKQQLRFDGQKADVFSLGVIVFTLIFNEYPQLQSQQFSNSGGCGGACMEGGEAASSWFERVIEKIKLIEMHNSEEDVFDMLELISAMLNLDPRNRPSIFEIEESNFLTSQSHISVLEAIAIHEDEKEQANQQSVAAAAAAAVAAATAVTEIFVIDHSSEFEDDEADDSEDIQELKRQVELIEESEAKLKAVGGEGMCYNNNSEIIKGNQSAGQKSSNNMHHA